MEIRKAIAIFRALVDKVTLAPKADGNLAIILRGDLDPALCERAR